MARMSGIRRDAAHFLDLQSVGRVTVWLFGELTRRNLYVADLAYTGIRGGCWTLRDVSLIELFDEADTELLLSTDIVTHIAYTAGSVITLSFS